MERTMRVLIVEDEAITALDLRQCIADFGYQVVGVADSCVEAIRLAEEARPDIALLDFHLKGPVDGMTTARELSRRAVRIIFVTAYLEQVLQHARDLATGYLAKPVSRRDVRLALMDAGGEDSDRRRALAC